MSASGTHRERELVLVADRSRARFFIRRPDDPELDELGDLLNPAGRLPARALVSDRQGRGFNRQRGSRTALGNNGLQRTHAERFARQVVARLAAELRIWQAARAYIFADAEFLGLLRATLRTRRIRAALHLSAKNLTRAATRRIYAELPGSAPDGE